MKIEWQLSSHGAGEYSVQLFRGGKLIDDAAIVKEINGWRVVSLLNESLSEGTQHATPKAAAQHHAKTQTYCEPTPAGWDHV